MAKYVVANGRGKRVGMLELNEVKGTSVVLSFWGSRKTAILKVTHCVPFGLMVTVKWKDLERIKRAGLLLPYEPQDWEKECQHDWVIHPDTVDRDKHEICRACRHWVFKESSDVGDAK